MKQNYIKCSLLWVLMGCFLPLTFSQTALKGKIQDAETGEELIGATVAVTGTGKGAVTDYEGNFFLSIDRFPVVLHITYTGYVEQDITVQNALERLAVRLQPNAVVLNEAVITGQRIDEKAKTAPLSVETMDAIAIKETPAVSFYNGLGTMKGVDLTTASLGFTVINMRGFNSTSPVRSLQTIDGVDNQAPGLNFSLGNFLGASELDIKKVELVAGASSSFYGPNAFNGVIAMQTKDPFVDKGLAASIKVGERNLLEGAVRWADAFKNKSGKEFIAYKLNFFGLKADDWVADNYDPVTGTTDNQVFSAANNPGGTNAVNIYGDESTTPYESTWESSAGINRVYRRGYKEEQLVDYDTKNIKANAAIHIRTNPSQDFDSPELIFNTSFGSGTTVYQGDNRFSLKNILFFQNRLEFRKRDKFFVRFYATNEDAGDSYDPYFTALKMLDSSKTYNQWNASYLSWWSSTPLGGGIFKKMKDLGYGPPEDFAGLIAWQQNNADSLRAWHEQAASYANSANSFQFNSKDFFEPGTARFDSLFNTLTTKRNNSRENGTMFYDKSALYHGHGEYRFTPKFMESITVGANFRLYRPISDGTIFYDTSFVTIQTKPDGSTYLDTSKIVIRNNEWGAYIGGEKKVSDFRFSATVRLDKNQNFDLLATPAASIVWQPTSNDYLRLSFASAIRNPTLSDQYLFLNVGPATLLGNLNGLDSLITLESFRDFLNDVGTVKYQNIKPIQPEKVKTFEFGYRTTLFNNLFIDAAYYFNIYNDFIGYNIGAKIPLDQFGQLDKFNFKIFRIASNAQETVTSQGVAIGLNRYFGKYYMASANYSWNKLNTQADDPIVPAFNTPEHKFNIGLSARDIPIKTKQQGNLLLGFSVNYKWIDEFVFEGSPQFTGVIPSYDMVDAQINLKIPKKDLILKIGASNVLNNKQFQTYGGPRIGRMAYISLVYDFRKP